MKCEVQRVYKNPRFRILKIDEESYILDMGKSIWKTIFPFLTWIVPNTIYKVDGEEINSKMKHIERDKSNDTSLGILGTGIGIFLAYMLRPLTDYFNIQSTMLVNSVLATLMLLLVVGVRRFISNRHKKNFYNLIESGSLYKRTIWIKPQSFKHFIQVLSIYLLILCVFLFDIILFITDGNMMLLIVATFFLFTLSILNGTTVINGQTTVKFKSYR
ncbi:MULTISPECIES: DUF443 family protein [Gracilibacillus]|uniref:DUF443 family protein n=1 Tax=Gracilibacillus thailandensis TaxID=563735 RepID=A0A6N7R369_9BACI|nr:MULTISPECIES: DUF443 family protein [Gracilibacillus]MRI66736.1 DUF443 family protein [Gracilibacillus thailandensis]